jgi:hypothetical protein
LRRVVLALAVLGTLTALFYAIEDWRGRAAWEACKRDLSAKGLEIEWAKYVPTDSVPDADNFFKAPKMQEWFVRSDASKPGWRIAFVGQSNPIVVAEVKVILPGTRENVEKADGFFQLNDAATPQQTEKLVLDAIGPHVFGSQGYTFVARPAENIKPLRIILRADKLPEWKEIAALFPERALSPRDFVPRTTSELKLEAAGNNAFRVLLDPAPQTAAAFVAATDAMKPEFDLLRNALKRPCARAEGGYLSPTEVPVPNFVQMRTVGQLFAERAQCHLMLGQPDEALQDLMVIDGLCRVLECRPSGPVTLVGAMINVALRGIYSQVVADGFRLGAWREPQIAAIEEQLRQVSLMPQVRLTFREAGAAFCHHLETFTAAEVARSIRMTEGKGPPKGIWDYLKDDEYWFFGLAPRGWRYQNMVVGARAHEMMDQEFDVAREMIDPGKAAEAAIFVGRLGAGPYTHFVARFIPNYMRAGMVLGYQQTMANEALIACALERYRAAEGKYPETLDVLAPKYLDKIPKDIIGGKPLIYHRTDDGKFMLYSIGWNQKDDGGVTGRSKTGAMEWGNGDWVWLNCQN